MSHAVLLSWRKWGTLRLAASYSFLYDASLSCSDIDTDTCSLFLSVSTSCGSLTFLFCYLPDYDIRCTLFCQMDSRRRARSSERRKNVKY